MKHGWLFASRSQLARSLRAVRLVHAALQCAWLKTNLPEHPGDCFRVNPLAIVRSAGDGNLFFSETKMIRRAGCDKRQRLMRLGRRAQESYSLRHAELRDRSSVSIN